MRGKATLLVGVSRDGRKTVVRVRVEYELREHPTYCKLKLKRYILCDLDLAEPILTQIVQPSALKKLEQ